MSLTQRNGQIAQECNPYHAFILAIENGEFDNVNRILMRDNINEYVHPVGALQVTALQVAAWQGNIDLLNQLHDRGADVNSQDRIGRSALYYAAHNGDVNVTNWLLQRGACVNVKTGVHSCSRSPSRNVSNSSLTRSHGIGRKLPLPERYGRTPLHEAVKNNHAEVVRILVKNGADVNANDDGQITPLLLAGSMVNRDDLNKMTKFVEIIKILVDAKVDVDVAHPETGTTALHHAAKLGSAQATQILLSNGAKPMQTCKNSKKQAESTPLHIAASIGNIETLMVLLEAIPSCDIDTPDQVNRTALHRASYNGHRECIRALINYEANLAAVTETGITVVDAIFAHISQPLAFLTDILNSCVQTTSSTKGSYENITVDFGILTPKCQMQMSVVTAIIAASSDITQLAILQHPLVETFLRLKWTRLRILFFVLMFVHLFFVISLSVYAIMLVRDNTDHVITRRILTLCSCILLFHNTIQVILEPRHYLRQLETWLSFICVMLSLVTSIAGEFVMCSQEENDSQYCVQWLLHPISIALLLSWMQMMLLIGRVPMWGYYALMFSTVLKNLLKVLLAFGYLIIGFALSFAVLFHGNNQFHHFGNAIVKTIVMMMGEYEYKELFNMEKNDTSIDSEITFLPVTSRIVFFIFIMLASIVLMNLMIGLAVNDIQDLEKEGHIRRLLKQAEFVAHLERVLSHRIFRSKWIPRRIRILLQSRREIPTKIILYPRENYFNYMTYFEKEAPPKIPTNLIEALFVLATKTSFKNDSSMDRSVEIGDTNLIPILSNLEEQIRELKAYCYRNLTNRKPSKRRVFKRRQRRLVNS
ncbi:transient receptor potential channel pyrexia-like isoform X1 [Pogonomyrmex barbatus]|uniref:Transient receptor potential channel pyrexia-like isoform X1 n=1 Tax=Pogonomyrmex barbatus TaxID=144034 RepID=A0A6I9VZY9_9HYME|nr:transient receptor potential channel pyrexia-like isoform X1 [Pogonomyrmex barbatus]